MTKKEIAELFERIITSKDLQSNGQLFSDAILEESEKIYRTDREELVTLMREWLELRSNTYTALAIKVAEKLRLTELVLDLVRLHKAVGDGECFYPFYREVLGEALEIITGKDAIDVIWSSRAIMDRM